MLTPVWMIPPNNFPIFQLAQVTPMRGVRPLLPPKLSISRQYWASAVVWVCNWAGNMNRQTNYTWKLSMNQRKQLFCCIFDSICMNKTFTYPSVRKEFLRWVMMGVGRLVCSTSLKQFFPVLVAWIFGYVWLLSSLPGRSINSYRISVLRAARTMGTWSSLSSLILNGSSKKCPLF